MVKKARNNIIVVTACIGIITCLADNIITFILARKYPGYSHLTDTLSKLGESSSPVSKMISCWWILMSIFFLFFAIGYYLSFLHLGKPAKTGTLLITVYALGEGMGSGLFPANYTEHGYTFSLIIHDTFSGIGVGSIIILPMVMLYMFPKEKFRKFYLFSIIITVTGLSLLILFSIAKMFYDPDSIMLSYKGLWQRLMNANYYLYLVVIACMILRKNPGISRVTTKPNLTYKKVKQS